MTVTQKKMEHSSSQETRCTRCGSQLPPYATFCGICGERIEHAGKSSKAQKHETTEVVERYHINTFVRRRPYIQLFLAIDNLHQRPVAIRDIDVSALNDEGRSRAIEVAQQEYDLLRRLSIPDLMPVIDQRHTQGHLFAVMSWPFQPARSEAAEQDRLQIHTLQDLLQSGIGRPKGKTAFSWIYRLCLTVDQLHKQGIVLGDLDPYAIAVSRQDYTGLPALMLSWLPMPLRALLPETSTTGNATHFSAPEALEGEIETRSDIYSLGALLYLLVTGTAPVEPSLRSQLYLAQPRELNPHVNKELDAIIMRALAVDRTERFQSAGDMADALLRLKPIIKPPRTTTRLDAPYPGPIRSAGQVTQPADSDTIDDPEDVTISIVPLRAHLAHLHLSRYQSQIDASGEATQTPLQDTKQQEPSVADDRPTPLVVEETATAVESAAITEQAHDTGSSDVEESFAERFKKHITGVLPAIPRLISPGKQKGNSVPDAILSPTKGSGAQEELAENDRSFFKRLQRFVLGEQQYTSTAVALIETPLRVQPDQDYALRIHLMGRDKPSEAEAYRAERAGQHVQLSGLSAMVNGDIVRIEVRSALYQNYAYIVQSADVRVPQQGYAAEVTIPMRALDNGPTGRRERLHIFFMNEKRYPLYEKPFVVEIFISPLVQSGREGHNVLTIPL